MEDTSIIIRQFSKKINKQEVIFNANNIKAEIIVMQHNKKASKYKITINEEEYHHDSIIGYGTHGFVSLYKNKHNNVIAVKESKLEKFYTHKYDNLLDDIKIINSISKNITCKDICIRSYVINTNDANKIIIMEHMDGTLYDLIQKMKYKQMDNINGFKIILLIIKKVLIDILLLYEHEYYYTDLKIDNIVYTVNEYDNVTIKLCDYGSIIHTNSNDAISTFPSPKGYKYNTLNPGIYNNIYINDIIWICQINILIIIYEFCSLRNYKFTTYSYSNYYKSLNDAIESIIIDVNYQFLDINKKLFNRSENNNIDKFRDIILNNFKNYEHLDKINFIILINSINLLYNDLI